jgi:UDP-N-acetylmuramate-alanine ligase
MAKIKPQVFYACKSDGSSNDTLVHVTPRAYWNKHGVCDDQNTDESVCDFLNQYEIYEAAESLFETDKSPEEVTEILKKTGVFFEDPEFTSFIRSCL